MNVDLFSKLLALLAVSSHIIDVAGANTGLRQHETSNCKCYANGQQNEKYCESGKVGLASCIADTRCHWGPEEVKDCAAMSSPCKDENKNCKYWAGIGECAKNPNYMVDKCQKSCDSCYCRNNNSYCNYWGSIGECTKNPSYMLMNCQVSCNSCCRNKNISCKYWAGKGYCTYKYTAYMEQNCEVSCNSCTRSDGDVMEDTEDLVQPPGPDSDFNTAMKDTEDPAQPPGPDSDYNTAMKDTEDPVQPPGTDSAYNTGMKDTEDPVQPPGTDSDIM